MSGIVEQCDKGLIFLLSGRFIAGRSNWQLTQSRSRPTINIYKLKTKPSNATTQDEIIYYQKGMENDACWAYLVSNRHACYVSHHTFIVNSGTPHHYF